jgi:DNA invertase Pin-like site-specific DNA recombinase
VKSPKTSGKAPAVPSAYGWKLGYARVSTQDQNLDMQVQALQKYGCNHIFTEKLSGTSKKRPQLDRVWKELRPGDEFVVWSLDRLGRSVRDLLDRIAALEQRGVKFVSLRENIDTSTAIGRLMLSVRAALAQFERDLTSERTSSGIQAKIARGEKVHAAWKERFDRDAVRKMLGSGMTTSEVAKRCRVTKSAIYKAIPAHEREELFRKGQRALARKKRQN